MKKIYERSNNYRYYFFKNHKGLFNCGLYHCAYCGRLMRRKNVSVDHIISVGSVKTSGFGRFLLFINRIYDVNSPENLTASCKMCNGEKGAKGGHWIIAGTLGRHWWYWIIKRIIQIVIYSCMILSAMPVEKQCEIISILRNIIEI